MCRAIGERARFPTGARVQVVHPDGIPLRSEHPSDAPTLCEQMAMGQQATVHELVGDWLRIELDDGARGWARWYYDGTRYVDIVQ